VIEKVLVRIARFVYGFYIPVIILSFILTGLSIHYASKLEIKTNIGDLLPENTFSVKNLKRISDQLGAAGWLMVMVEVMLWVERPVWLRGPGPKIVCRLTGWPSIGRTWRVYMAHAEFNIDTEQLPRDDEGLVMRFRMRRAEDSAKPSALDIVPFIFGAGLGLLFACTR